MYGATRLAVKAKVPAGSMRAVGICSKPTLPLSPWLYQVTWLLSPPSACAGAAATASAASTARVRA